MNKIEMFNEIDIYGDLDNYNAEQLLKQKSNEMQILEEKYNNSIKIFNDLKNEKKELQKKLKNIERSFWSLLETAKIEVNRKDNQINELRREIDNITFRRYNYGNQNKSETYLGKSEIVNRGKVNSRDFKNNSKNQISHIEYNKKFEKDSREVSQNKNLQNEKQEIVTKTGQEAEVTVSEKEKKKNESYIKSKLLEDVKEMKKKSVNFEKCNTEVIAISKAESVTKNFNDLLFDEMLNENTSLNIKSDNINLYENLERKLNKNKFVRETESNNASEEVENNKMEDYINDNNLITSENIALQNPQKIIACEKPEVISDISHEIYEFINEIDSKSNNSVEKKFKKLEDNFDSEKSLTNCGTNNSQKAIVATTTDKCIKLCSLSKSEKTETPISNITLPENIEIFSTNVNKSKNEKNSPLSKRKNEKLMGHHIDGFEPENNEKQIEEALKLKKNLFEEIISENCVNENIFDKKLDHNLDFNTTNISNISTVVKNNNTCSGDQKIEEINETINQKGILNCLMNKNSQINVHNENIIGTIKKNQKELFTSNSSTISTVSNNSDKTTEQISEPLKEFKNKSYTIADSCLSLNIGLSNVHNEINNKIKKNVKDFEKELNIPNSSSVNNKGEISGILDIPEKVSTASNNMMCVKKENNDQIRLTTKHVKNKIHKMLDSKLTLNNDDTTITQEIKVSENSTNLKNEIFDKFTNTVTDLKMEGNAQADKTLKGHVEEINKSETHKSPKKNKSKQILNINKIQTKPEFSKKNLLMLDKIEQFSTEIEKLQNFESNKTENKIRTKNENTENKPNAIEISSVPTDNISEPLNKNEKLYTKINILENIQIAPPNHDSISSQINNDDLQIIDGSNLNIDPKNVPPFSLRDTKPKILKPDVKKILPLLNNSLEINKAATDELVKILDKAPKINRTPKKYSFDTIKNTDTISPSLSNQTITKSVHPKTLDKIQSENVDTIKNSDFSPNQSETLEATQFLTDNFLISNSENSPLKGILKQLFGDTPKRNGIEDEQNNLKYVLTSPKIKSNFKKLQNKCVRSSTKLPIVKISKKLNYKLSNKKIIKSQEKFVSSKNDLNLKTVKKNFKNGKWKSKREYKKNKILKNSRHHLNQLTKCTGVFENGSKENSTHFSNQSIIDAYLIECNKCRELENEVSKKIFGQSTSPNVHLWNNASSKSSVENVNIDANKENGKDYLQKQIDDIFGKSPFNLEYGQTSDCIVDESINKSSELNNSNGSQKRLSTSDKIYEMSIDCDGNPIWNITKRRKRKRKISKSPENSSFENVKKKKVVNLINSPHEDCNNKDQFFSDKKENSTKHNLLNESSVSETSEKPIFSENVRKDIYLKQNEKPFLCSYKIPKVNKTSKTKNSIEKSCDSSKDIQIILENNITNVGKKQYNLFCNESIPSLPNDFDMKIGQENVVTDNENSFKQQFKSPHRIVQDINKSSDNDIEQEFLRIFGKSPNISQNTEISQIDDSLNILNNQDILTIESKTVDNNNSNVNKNDNFNEEHNETYNNISITSLNASHKSFSTSTKTYEKVCDENDGSVTWIIKRKLR